MLSLVKRAGTTRSLVTTTHRPRSSIRALFKTDEGSWVLPAKIKPKGIVHFIGGAFAGAAPHLLYSLFLDLLAEEGYSVIATPFAISFDHQKLAVSVRSQFNLTLSRLRDDDPSRTPGLSRSFSEDLPLIGLGHSMGSLLHLLIGSLPADEGKMTDFNILLSFNNKQVSDAIPIPGLLGALKPAVGLGNQVFSSLPVSLSSQLTATNLLGSAMGFIPGPLRSVIDMDGRVTRSALALDQLNQVVQEVGAGADDFRPSPSETKSIIQESYRCKDTVLVRFSDDSIDESNELGTLLQNRTRSIKPLTLERDLLTRPLQGKADVTLLELPGTHLTPCGGDLNLKQALMEIQGASGSKSGSKIGGEKPRDDIRSIGLKGFEVMSEVIRVQSQADIRRMGYQVIKSMDKRLPYYSREDIDVEAD